MLDQGWVNLAAAIAAITVVGFALADRNSVFILAMAARQRVKPR